MVSPFIKDIKTPTLNYKDVQIMEQLIFTDEAISVGFGIPLDMLMIKSKVGTESKIIVDRQDYYESIVPDNKVYLNGFLNEITKKFKTQLKFPELADIYV